MSAEFKTRNTKGVETTVVATPLKPTENGELPGGPLATGAMAGCVMRSNMRRAESGERAKLSGCDEVANFLRFVRCALELTQDDMAKLVRPVAPKCDATTWGRWERGKNEPGAKVFLFVQRLFEEHEAKRRTA